MNRSALAVLVLTLSLPVAAQRRVPKDLSGVRGFNYQSGESIGHVEHWLQYDPTITERDLDCAKRLQLNQVRVFIPYAAWARNKEGLKKNLLHFVRAAHQRGIGVMPTMQYKFEEWKDKAAWPNSREFVADIVATIGKEPGLEIWDVENEPECCKLQAAADTGQSPAYGACDVHGKDLSRTRRRNAGHHRRDVCRKHDRNGRRR